MKIVGWILFLCAMGLFTMQIGFLIASTRLQIEYIDHRLFYIINSLCILCIALAIFLLIRITRKVMLIGVSIALLLIISQIILLHESNKNIKNITSISPDFKHVMSIKENVMSGEAVYYRSYYGILGRPKETLPYKTVGKYKVEWLAKDVAAVTYKSSNDTIQQFIATYGDRGGGTSYYYVGAEIHGTWEGDDVKVISAPEGITVNVNRETELFEWENIVQFGTLAVVLRKNDEAVWTISLSENFKVDSDSYEKREGNIRLYKAIMENNRPITLN